MHEVSWSRKDDYELHSRNQVVPKTWRFGKAEEIQESEQVCGSAE